MSGESHERKKNFNFRLPGGRREEGEEEEEEEEVRRRIKAGRSRTSLYRDELPTIKYF